MLRLAERRRAYQKAEAKKKKQELKEANSTNRSLARTMIKEISPNHFVHVAEIEERLVREGHFFGAKEYFRIRDEDYLRRAHELYKEYPVFRDMLNIKVDILTLDIRLEPETFLAKDKYIIDEVAKYLALHDIALRDTGLTREHQYKFHILH